MTLERKTVHVSDDTGRIAMLEVKTVDTERDLSPVSLKRFIYSNHLQSAGLELDETGAVISYEGYHHGARYYTLWLCRWVSVDPLESEYAGWSPYHYVKCNPINDTDSTGMGVDDDRVVGVKPMPNGRWVFSGSGMIQSYELPEAEIRETRPDALILVPHSDSFIKPNVVSIKTILEWSKNLKEAKKSWNEVSEVINNAMSNLGYVEEIKDGLNPKTTATIEEMAKLPEIKSGKDLLKDAHKEISTYTKDVAGFVSTVYDVGTKGPANVSPLTAAIYDRWEKQTFDGQPSKYGNTIFDNADFTSAENKGYFALAEYVNGTNNISNYGFVYSTSGLLGRKGILDSISGNNYLDSFFATAKPLDEKELKQKELGVSINFAYWGLFLDKKLMLKREFNLKKANE